MADAAKVARRALVESVGEVDEEMVESPLLQPDLRLIFISGRHFLGGKRPDSLAARSGHSARND